AANCRERQPRSGHREYSRRAHGAPARNAVPEGGSGGLSQISGVSASEWKVVGSAARHAARRSVGGARRDRQRLWV
ncbi:hypothetical protein ACSTJG_25340, partial [Vibrio parahaemolyticus]